MICACGTSARYVRNGASERLNYWFCDTCKDEPKLSEPPTDDLSQLDYNLDIGGTQTGRLPMPPMYVPLQWVVYGRDSATGQTMQVSFPTLIPCSPGLHRGSGAHTQNLCNCGQVSY